MFWSRGGVNQYLAKRFAAQMSMIEFFHLLPTLSPKTCCFKNVKKTAPLSSIHLFQRSKALWFLPHHHTFKKMAHVRRQECLYQFGVDYFLCTEHLEEHEGRTASLRKNISISNSSLSNSSSIKTSITHRIGKHISNWKHNKAKRQN